MFQRLPIFTTQKESVLDTPYFHVVFTVPEELNPVIFSNQQLLYDALYHAASATLSELTKDPKYLGADSGFICVLHSWGSSMKFHPHLHVIQLGGGLNQKNEWMSKENGYFLPVQILSRIFRGKYLEELKALWQDGKLHFYGTAEKFQNRYAFKELLDLCYRINWITYCKETFNGAQSVIDYLGKYTHRIAISNHRIKRIEGNSVIYTAKDYKNKGCWQEIKIPGEEFIRRFFMHVPPKRFVRIRHYGILSTRNKTKKITLCRNLIGCEKYISRLKGLNSSAIIKLLYGVDVCKCTSCGGHMVSTKDMSSRHLRMHPKMQC